jgi:glutamate racemase
VTNSTDARAIGIFDSGLGGLTVARAVRDAFPGESLCYLGDTARVPYGTKSATTVTAYAREDIAFLLRHGVKAVIAACNTVSAAALPGLADDYDVPVIGVVEKGADAALARDEGQADGHPRKIGVIGTETTVGSEAYVRAIARRSPEAQVLQKACPLFVPLIEEGWLDHAVTREVVREYLTPMRADGIDTLILGCTHYPLIAPLLADFFGPGVRIVDSARVMAIALERAFRKGVILPAPTGGEARINYFVTDRYHRFRDLATAFMGGDCIDVQLVASDELVAGSVAW